MAAEPGDIVRQVERQWRDALLAKDVDALRQLIHPQFKLVGVRASGSIAVDREGWIEALGRMDIASLEINVLDNVCLKTCMVATVDAQWQVRYLGQLIDERVLLTDVWVFEEDRWQALRRHSSTVPAGVKLDS